MKRNTSYVDNRAVWEIKKIISENDIDNNQLKSLVEPATSANSNFAGVKIVKNLRSALHSFTYIFT